MQVGSVLPKGKTDLSLASVTTSVQCMCIMHPSRFVWAITSTFMHGFQNNMAQLFI